MSASRTAKRPLRKAGKQESRNGQIAFPAFLLSLAALFWFRIVRARSNADHLRRNFLK